MSTNTNGLTRPKSAGVGFFDIKKQTTSSLTNEVEAAGVVRVNTDLPASPFNARAVGSYNDMHDSTLAVCSGTVKAFANGIGVQINDCVSGETATFARVWQGWLPSKAADTIAAGDVLYWDATNYELTTTSSGNTKAGFVRAMDADGTFTKTVSTATFDSLPVAEYVTIAIQPY